MSKPAWIAEPTDSLDVLEKRFRAWFKGKTATKIVRSTLPHLPWLAVVYHGTRVVVVYDEPEQFKVRLVTGGWYTATTKKRMNDVARLMGASFGVSQTKYKWYCNGAPFEGEAWVSVPKKGKHL